MKRFLKSLSLMPNRDHILLSQFLGAVYNMRHEAHYLESTLKERRRILVARSMTDGGANQPNNIDHCRDDGKLISCFLPDHVSACMS